MPPTATAPTTTPAASSVLIASPPGETGSHRSCAGDHAWERLKHSSGAREVRSRKSEVSTTEDVPGSSPEGQGCRMKGQPGFPDELVLRSSLPLPGNLG